MGIYGQIAEEAVIGKLLAIGVIQMNQNFIRLLTVVGKEDQNCLSSVLDLKYTEIFIPVQVSNQDLCFNISYPQKFMYIGL